FLVKICNNSKNWKKTLQFDNLAFRIRIFSTTYRLILSGFKITQAILGAAVEPSPIACVVLEAATPPRNIFLLSRSHYCLSSSDESILMMIVLFTVLVMFGGIVQETFLPQLRRASSVASAS
ncbi:hypothetical protein L9F63_007978, partial [Diploptera punctata]